MDDNFEDIEGFEGGTCARTRKFDAKCAATTNLILEGGVEVGGAQDLLSCNICATIVGEQETKKSLEWTRDDCSKDVECGTCARTRKFDDKCAATRNLTLEGGIILGKLEAGAAQVLLMLRGSCS